MKSGINGLDKVTDDINITRLQLVIENKAFKEDLLFMKQQHEEEVNVLPNQIANSVLTGKLDAPKSQDLMTDIWAQYDELTLRKGEELDKYWSQIDNYWSQTAETGAPEMILMG